MIGLDTNILARILVQDDDAQAAKVKTFLESLDAKRPGYISHSVLMELVWVLSSSYAYDRAQVSHALELLLRAVGLAVEKPDVVWSVLRSYRDSRADFADLLIERGCAAAGCEYTVTFDVHSSRRAGMRLLR